MNENFLGLKNELKKIAYLSSVYYDLTVLAPTAARVATETSSENAQKKQLAKSAGLPIKFSLNITKPTNNIPVPEITVCNAFATNRSLNVLFVDSYNTVIALSSILNCGILLLPGIGTLVGKLNWGNAKADILESVATAAISADLDLI